MIPVAVRTGAIGEIGHWVFRKATAQLAAWRRGGRDLSMAVNVTPAELGSLGPELAAMLAANRVPADRLVLEIAESRIEDGAALAENAGALRLAGVRTALDAFGAEPASLAHLRRLPIDMVKLGQSFFGDVRPRVPAPRRSAEAAHVVDLLVGVGRRLGVEVVAHGLEAPEQLEVARTAGCRMGQGHLFARPQPPSAPRPTSTASADQATSHANLEPRGVERGADPPRDVILCPRGGSTRFEVTQVLDAIERHLTTEPALAQAVVDLGHVAWYGALDGGRSVSLLRVGLLVDALARHLGEDAVMIYGVTSRELLTDADLTSKERMVLGRWSGDGMIEVVPVMADRVAEVADITGLPVVTIDGFPGLERRYPWLRGVPERVLHLVPGEGGARIVGGHPIAGAVEGRAALLGRVWHCVRRDCPLFGERRGFSQAVARMKAGVPVCRSTTSH